MLTSIPARSDRASSPQRDNGFTLVELMVVIAIIGLVSAVVVLAMPDPRGRVVDDADRFAGRLSSARDQAIVQGRPIAVWVAPTGYGFKARRDGAWIALEDRPFATTRWREGTAAAPGQGERAEISFDSIGLPSAPLAVRLFREGAQASITLDMAGRVKVSG